MIILLASVFIINIFLCKECNEMARCRSKGEWVSRNSGPFPFCPLREIIRSGHTQSEWVFVTGRGFESWIIYWTRHISDLLTQQDGDGSFSNLDLLSAGVSRLTTSRRFTRSSAESDLSSGEQLLPKWRWRDERHFLWKIIHQIWQSSSWNGLL